VVKKHFHHVFMGMNLRKRFFSFDTDVRDHRLASGLSVTFIVAGVTAVDGRPERGRSVTLLCRSDNANRFAQRLTLLLSTATFP
jgi:hypothetical protein